MIRYNKLVYDKVLIIISLLYDKIVEYVWPRVIQSQI